MSFPIPSHRLALAACVVFAACAPSVTQDEPITVSAATLALFAPDSANPCGSVLPFPSDLAKDPRTGRLNLPFCMTDTPEQIAMKTGLRTLDGYALGTTLTTRFSAAIDPASAASAVRIYEASTGEAVAFETRFSAAAGNTLFIQPTAPLAERTRYLVAITTELLDGAGKPVASDVVFALAKSEEPLVDEAGYSRFAAISDGNANALEPLRQGFSSLFAGLSAKGLTRGQIAVAWSFTTQTGHSALPPLAALVAHRGGAWVIHDDQLAAAKHPLIAAAGIPAANLCDVHTGRVTLQGLLTPTGTFGATAAGVPVSSLLTVDYVLTTPNLDFPAACSTSWRGERLVVFAHGLGRCKNDALALANVFAKAGFAVLSLDGPRAGSRSVSNLGDQNLDGCLDQPATPELIALPGQNPNPFALRDHLREWGLELAQVTAFARSNAFRFAGLPSGVASTRVALVGHSWGGLAAALAGSLGNVDVVALNAASAELGAVFAPSLGAATAAGLTAAGVDLSTPAGVAQLEQGTAERVAAFRWALEPGDPLYAAAAYPPAATLPVLVQIVSAGAADAPLHATQTQQKLAQAFNRAPLAETTFDLTTGGAALCDSPSAAVGALLQPCVAQKTALGYPLALIRTAALQRQLVTYVATSMAGPPLVCSPDNMVACQ